MEKVYISLSVLAILTSIAFVSLLSFVSMSVALAAESFGTVDSEAVESPY